MPETTQAEHGRQFLDRLLREHQLSKYRLARMLGVTRRAVTYWAQGEHPVPAWIMERMQRLDTSLHVQAGDVQAGCPWPQTRTEESGALPDPLETMRHLDTCPTCMGRAYGAVLAHAVAHPRRRAGQR